MSIAHGRPVSDPRLNARGDLPAELWVEPTSEQWFLVRYFRSYFAPQPHEERGLTRWFSRFFVVPSTNLTNFSLQYQSYLNDIFHTTAVARVVHFVCMPLITALFLVALRPLRAFSVEGDAIGAVLLASWWFAWAARERLLLWGATTTVWAATLLVGARWFAVTGLSPWPPLVVLAFFQALSHTAEPNLPPRVSGTARWVPMREHFAVRGLALVGRLITAIETMIYGTIDEAIASPRLAPIQLLEVLWMLGYAPGQRAAWKALSARAIASGQPALDYIGTGGGTTLRARD